MKNADKRKASLNSCGPAANLRQKIKTLKRRIRKHKESLQRAMTINFQTLFDIWADFDDEESPKEVTRFCGDLGNMDAISFMAFYYGHEKAIQKIKELL